jgi:hypothetical protein
MAEIEMVNHPSHYGGKENPYETIKVIRAWGLNFSLGNAVKYISRRGKKHKDKTIEDLEKAIFYIQEEIDYLNNNKTYSGIMKRTDEKDNTNTLTYLIPKGGSV